MAHILISGLINTETTVQVRQFPIPYYPIDYPFFGVNTAVAGVGYNLARALTTLGDQVQLHAMVGRDFPAQYIRQQLRQAGIEDSQVTAALDQTPSSVVLYDGSGRRQIYCDLKDIQETSRAFSPQMLQGVDLVAACNISFNRPLLHLARQAGLPIATDVHVLSSIDDDYNREFMACANVLFLSDEAIGDHYAPFLRALAGRYGNDLIVLGRGGKGAALYLPGQDRILEQPAPQLGPVTNTVGAGDALFAGFCHFFAQGLPPEAALWRAQCFAAAKIRHSGAAQGFVTEAELQRLL